MKVSVILPVHQPGEPLACLLDALAGQRPPVDELLVLETGYEPGVRPLVERVGGRHLAIGADEYDHAGSRSAAVREASGDVVVLLSQDVCPADEHGLARLVAPLAGAGHVAASFGRQLSEPDAHPLMEFKRRYLYPATDDERGLDDRGRLGFRTVQMSNAFAAYRRDRLAEVGWFGERQLVCEDVSVAARLLRAGHRIRYVAGALVVHAHRSGFADELRRYFDIGAAYQRDPVILDTFGRPRREGWRFVSCGVRWLAHSGRSALIPQFLALCAGKRLFFALGRRSRWLPRGLPPRLSTFPDWWRRTAP